MDDFEEVAVALCHELRAKAATDRDNAGYSGEYSDRGAAALEAQVEAFIAGMRRRFPREWQERANAISQRLERQRQEAELRKDPEWAEFERLRQKFKTT